MVTINRASFRHLAERIRQIGSVRQESVIEAISRAHAHRFLGLRRQAANEDMSAAPIPDKEPPPYTPPPPPPYWTALLSPPPPYSPPPGVSAEDDEPQQDAETEGINHRGGDNGVPEEIDPAGVCTRRNKVD
jgi:hypothetical protein